MRPHFVSLSLLFGLASCYTTQSLKVQDFRALGRRLDDTASVSSSHGEGIGIDAQTSVRVGIAETGWSDWISAGNLHVTDEALFLEAPVASGAIVAAIANNLDEREVALLRQMSPPGGACVTEAGPTGHAFRLTAQEDGTLLPWIERFVIAQKQAGAVLGIWWVETRESSFFAGRRSRKGWLLFDQVGARPSARPVLAYGAPWSKVTRIDVNHLDPLLSTLVIPFFPVVLLLPPKDNGHVNENALTAEYPKTLWPDAEPAALFTPNARRRAIAKLVAQAGGGGTSAGDGFAEASLGLRFLNFFEIGAIARRAWLGSDTSDSPRQSATFWGARLGLHIDRDGDPGFAFHVAVDYFATGPGTDGTLSFLLGPRIGLGRGIFLAIPVGATSMCRKVGQATCARTEASAIGSAQIGVAY